MASRPRCLVLISAALLAACSAYDPTLVEPDRRGSFGARGTPVAGTTGGRGGGGGAGGSMAQSGGTGAPASDAGDPGDVTTRDGGTGNDAAVPACGDGRIANDETCDTAIADGQPGACPTECPSDQPCQPRDLQGSACQAECVDAVLPCTSGDGCCPPTCGNPEDDDCSASCGDGVVQPDAGETCEVPGLDSEVAADDVCPTECPDDGDECTAETLTGSPGNCNAVCTRTEIVSVDDDDDCCPDDANSTVDDDCPVRCGNNVVEAGEDCEGGPNCDDDCQSTVVTEPQRCMNAFTDATMSCRDCMCTDCIAAVNDCFDSDNAGRNADCAELVACGLEAGCRGAQCYCGLEVDPDNGTCLEGDGPCAALMDRIAGTPGPLSVYTQQFDLNTAIGRARVFSMCHGASCLDDCP